MPKSPEQYQPTKEEIKEAEGMMTKKEKEMSEERSEQIEKFIERFGEMKISDELKGQVLPHIDNKTLTIANEYLAAVVTERSEHGRGIGNWDQVRVFLQDQNTMKEWNWRHKDDQHLDKKHLRVQSIGSIEASKDRDQIIVKMELVNNYGKRTVDFEFPADKTKLPFEDGEIPMKIVKPTEAYARKEINDAIKYATDLEDIQNIAKANGLELTENDFRKVVENNLNIGRMERLKNAQKVAGECGLELSKDDYKRFMYNNLGRYDTNPAEDLKIVNSFAKFQKEDLQEIADYCIKNKIPSYVCYIDDDYGLIIAKKIVEYGKLDEENFHKIATTYIDRRIFSEASKLSKAHSFEFTKDEYQKLVNGFLSEAKDGLKNHKFSLKRAQEMAEAGGIEITEDDYKKFLEDCIAEMFRYEKRPTSLKDYPKDKLKEIQEIAKIAGIKLE